MSSIQNRQADEAPARARRGVVNRANYHRLSIFLSMDFGVVVLFRHNRTTRTLTCIWADGPSEADMKRQAWTYTNKISSLDLTCVDWVRSDVLLRAVNRHRGSQFAVAGMTQRSG